MSENIVKHKQTLLLSLTEDNYNKFMEENRSLLVSKLLTAYYESQKKGNRLFELMNADSMDDYVLFKVDEPIKEQFNNDVYKNIRAQMLLTEFYSNIPANSGNDNANLYTNRIENKSKSLSEEIKKENIHASDNIITPAMEDDKENNTKISDNNETAIDTSSSNIEIKDKRESKNRTSVVEKSNEQDRKISKETIIRAEDTKKVSNEKAETVEQEQEGKKKVTVVDEGNINAIFKFAKNNKSIL